MGPNHKRGELYKFVISQNASIIITHELSKITNNYVS
jgi:hypothetical protein